jgi:DNA-binding PadR family transcriptional regulator
MLRALLNLAATKETTRNDELAQALGVNPELIEPILEVLTKHGYLEQIVPGCSTPCDRCPVRTACLFANQPKLWAITPKGKAYLARTQSQESEAALNANHI